MNSCVIDLFDETYGLLKGRAISHDALYRAIGT